LRVNERTCIGDLQVLRQDQSLAPNRPCKVTVAGREVQVNNIGSFDMPAG
jgi:hypothetical protein